jgi:hypothetical protein
VLEAISGLVELGLLGLSIVIGVRLLRLAPAGSRGPELWLGLYFVIYSGLATGLSVGTYVGWSSASITLPDAAVRWLNAGFFATSTLGLSCLLLFTQRTFRPESRAAATGIGVTAGIMVSMTIWIGLSDGFAIRLLPGPAYWIHWTARLSAWIWVAGESFAYWSKQQRRLAVGLAEPVVTNRFLLWGVWGALTTVMAFADPLARVWYFRLSGSTSQWVVEVGRPIIQVVVSITCGLNIGAVALLFLTFFPSAGYKRWLATRGAVRA